MRKQDMEDRADRYRKEAERLRREAEVTKFDSIRQQLLAVAREYDALADSVDRIEGRAAAKCD